MKKNNLFYFKKGLILIIPIALIIIVQGLFEIGFSDFSQILKLLAKGIGVGVITGVILSLFNILAKIETFIEKE